MECSSIIATGFNGGGLRSHARLQKYLEYIKSFPPKESAVKTKAKLLRIPFWGHEGRGSEMGTSIPIWENGTPMPARVMLILGIAGLLSGMDIINQVGSTVNFRSNQFKVGQSGWGMMTFNEKHHCVFPLVPTSCDYVKLNGYFGQLR